MEGLAQRQPLVLLFDDLHWCDPTSLELIEQLFPLTDRVALMIVGVFRPWRQEPAWRIHETGSRDFGHRYRSISLEPLDAADSRTLVANLLEVEDLPESVRALILAKAEGNPFFVEEVIRSLLDAGLVVRQDDHWRATREIAGITVPDTLAGVITARLDQLDEESKGIAQTAAVIGRQFGYETLAEVHGDGVALEAALTNLQRRELVRERSRVPRRIYAFKHALTQETVYESILLRRRRELHRSIAERIEETDPDQAAELARHFVGAGDEKRALPHLVGAGESAARNYSTTEAIGLFCQAIDLLKENLDLELARRAYEGLGGVLAFANDVPRAMETYREMLALGESQNDLPMQVSALNKMGFVSALRLGEMPTAERYLSDAERIANECNDLAGLAEFHMTHCFLRTTGGDFDEALGHLADAAKIGEDLGAGEPLLFGLTHTANTLVYLTRFDDARDAIEIARNRAEELGDLGYVSELLGMTLPFCLLRDGDFDGARESALKGLELATQIGSAARMASASFILGQLAQFQGAYEQALSHHESALESARAAGATYLEAAVLCSLGTINLEIGGDRLEEGMRLHSESQEAIKQPLGNAFGAGIWAEIGFCQLAMGDGEKAAELFQRGLVESTGAKFLMRPMLLAGSAFVALGGGKLDDAAQFVREAREFVDQRSMKHFEPLIEFAEAQVAGAGGDAETSLGKFARAEELALQLGMLPLVWQARAGASQVLSASGQVEEADAKVTGARDMVREIADLFEDEKLRQQYLESASSRLG